MNPTRVIRIKNEMIHVQTSPIPLPPDSDNNYLGSISLVFFFCFKLQMRNRDKFIVGEFEQTSSISVCRDSLIGTVVEEEEEGTTSLSVFDIFVLLTD